MEIYSPFVPRFSLIVATVERSSELSVLLHSLAMQKLRDFELIIVDQNSDDRLLPLIKEWTSTAVGPDYDGVNSIQVKHLRCEPGVSRARNLGLSNCAGEILAFPDDDCWYFPDTLQKVDIWFREHVNYGILSLGSRDEKGEVSGNRWVQKECDLTRTNAFRTSATYTYFIRRPIDMTSLRFDETLGPAAGTAYGCGEDTDLLLTLMTGGIRGRFNSLLYVGHPLKIGFVNVQRAERYGGGFGRVLAKHSHPLLFCGLVIFDFARAASRMLIGDRQGASRFWAHANGMIQAYFSRSV